MFRWITPGERALLVAIAIGLTSCGWGALAYLIVGHYMAWVAYGGIFGGAVAYMVVRSSELTAWAMLEYQQAEQEYNRFKLIEDTQPVRYETTVNTDGANSMRGKLRYNEIKQMRNDIRLGRKFGVRAMGYVSDDTWKELRRIGLVQYINGKPNAGVELTPAGYQWARVKK